MPRIVQVLAAGHDGVPVIDTVILNLDERRLQRGVFAGVSGTRYDVDLADPVLLRMGNILVTEEGGLVEVVAEAEPLVEVRSRDVDALARLAWHLGDRHVPVEVLTNRLRLRRDPAIEKMLVALGAKVVAIEAPFNPEGGAYLVAPTAGHSHHHHAHHHHESHPPDHHHHHHHDD
jgi:urease accessory protein